MKRLFLLGFAFIAVFALKAQTSNLNLFTEQGERFSVIINGILQNPAPKSNMLITNLTASKYKIKIVFENNAIPEIDKFLYLSRGTESTYIVNQNNAGIYALRFLSDVSIEAAPRPNRSQLVIVYQNEPVTSTTTTTTVVKNNPNQGGIGFNVQDPVTGANINMNVNVGGLGDEQSSSTTSTTTTTTTRSTGNVVIGSTYSENSNEGNRERHHEHHNKDKYVLQGYNGVYGCQMPMAVEDFESAKKSISSKSFEDSKLTIAKQIIQSNCLLSSQVKEVMMLFSFEDTRLTFAKFAYAYTLDLGNYYKLNDAFSFESSIDDLNNYIQGYKK